MLPAAYCIIHNQIGRKRFRAIHCHVSIKCAQNHKASQGNQFLCRQSVLGQSIAMSVNCAQNYKAGQGDINTLQTEAF